ncbi:MAG: RHS repeat-associated core domain-containing protein [Aestuariibacter sp.]|nr:RHS repeat-associated core domain-containing protein [Aestuariibacter sp.]
MSSDESTVTTYTYDSANRLLVSGSAGRLVSYTWDERGNLVSDSTFTYTYNAAGRMVQAESLTVTLVYTYNAQGLRVAQSVDGGVNSFVWDWASGIPEMLADGDNLYLVGHDTLGQSANGRWGYYLPDALGSIRQTTDDVGAVSGSREWTPFGVEVGRARGGLGYTGEWFDSYTEFNYLRARWYAPQVGRFTQRDLWPGIPVDPLTLNPYVYALANPVLYSDPSGYQSDSETGYINRLYDRYIKDVANRLNVRNLTNMSDNAFAAMIAAKMLMEDATIYADQQPKGIGRELSTLPVTFLRDWAIYWVEQRPPFNGEISWGPANIPLPLAVQNLEWWEQMHLNLGLNFEDLTTYYYHARDYNWMMEWMLGNEVNQLAFELQRDEGAVNQMALSILQSSLRAKQYYLKRSLSSGSYLTSREIQPTIFGCREPIPELSAYAIAMGIIHFREDNKTLYEVSGWKSRGSPWNWVEAIDGTAKALDLDITRYVDYIPYTKEEENKLLTLPIE